MNKRVLACVLLLASVLLLPYWFYLPLLFLMVVVIPFFWEAILVAFLVETLYGSGAGTLLLSPVAMAVLILLIILVPLRKHLRWSSEDF